MGKLLMLKLIENLKKVSGTDLTHTVSDEVRKLDQAIERLKRAKNVDLFRTDYLE